MLFAASAQADDSQPITLWKITVYNSLGPHEYVPNREGGTVPTGILKPCVQEPMIIFKNKNGDLLEKVRITCEIGVLNSKVSLMTSCYLNKLDNSYGSMHVEDSIDKFTIELNCSTFIP